ncbi:unnamed protein product [Soboliphyme baturini]|uniref:Integrin_alpha2 domain-containing protein n=1 Tax=Soboliphyme baturini TaxID=241478 RepID=A0A183IC77_9BILA|nr:unnamed protein product [Soboliphyme baturini]
MLIYQRQKEASDHSDRSSNAGPAGSEFHAVPTDHATGEAAEQVEKFTYLWVVFIGDGKWEEEIDWHTETASGILHQLAQTHMTLLLLLIFACLTSAGAGKTQYFRVSSANMTSITFDLEQPTDWPTVYVTINASSFAEALVNPVQFHLVDKYSSLSWQLPYVLEGVTLYKAQRTLCPSPKLLSLRTESKMCRNDDARCEAVKMQFRQATAERKHFTLEAFTASREINFTVSSRSLQDVLLRLNKLDRRSGSVIKPVFCRFNFTGTTQNVKIRIQSADMLCAALVVQNQTV